MLGFDLNFKFSVEYALRSWYKPTKVHAAADLPKAKN